MNVQVTAAAEECSKRSDNDTITFPEVLGKLEDAGLEGYFCDLRRAVKTYYLPSGESLETPVDRAGAAIAQHFDANGVASAVKQSQRNEHTYADFCRKIAEAGCAGYLVTLPGWCTVYFGRDGAVYTEHFPKK